MNFVMWDGACYQQPFDAPEMKDCGFCEMRTTQTELGQPGAIHLFSKDSEVLMCHFQFSKDHPWYTTANTSSMKDVLEAPIIRSTYGQGVSISNVTNVGHYVSRSGRNGFGVNDTFGCGSIGIIEKIQRRIFR